MRVGVWWRGGWVTLQPYRVRSVLLLCDPSYAQDRDDSCKTGIPDQQQAGKHSPYGRNHMRPLRNQYIYKL
jgi:hypothetical protein